MRELCARESERARERRVDVGEEAVEVGGRDHVDRQLPVLRERACERMARLDEPAEQRCDQQVRDNPRREPNETAVLAVHPPCGCEEGREHAHPDSSLEAVCDRRESDRHCEEEKRRILDSLDRRGKRVDPCGEDYRNDQERGTAEPSRADRRLSETTMERRWHLSLTIGRAGRPLYASVRRGRNRPND